MGNETAEAIAQIRGFVEDKGAEIGVLREEQERMKQEVASILETQRAQKRAAMMRGLTNGGRPVVQSGKYAGMTPLELRIVGNILRAAERRPEDLDGRMLGDWRKSFDAARESIGQQRALDSTTAGSGSELTSAETARELWDDVHIATAVASLFPTIQMPSRTFDLPLELGNTNWYPGTANVAPPSTDPATAERTLTAYELATMIPWSYDLDEDAVVAVMGEVRSTLVRNASEVMDDVILNADTTAANNINADGVTLTTSTAGYAQHLIGFDGLRHIGLVDNTSQGNDHNAATSEAMYNEIRALMGKYGVRPSEIAFICDINTYIETVGIATSNVRTLDKYGPQATILTGELAAIEGVPLIVSEQLRQTDDDGKVTHPISDSGNDNGTLLCVNRTMYRKGFVRELLIETERDIQKRQTIMVASIRMAFDGRLANASDTAMAMQYNIT